MIVLTYHNDSQLLSKFYQAASIATLKISVHCYEISEPLLDFGDDRISPVARLDKMKIWNLYTLSLKNCTSIEFCWGYEFSNSENDFWMQIPAEAEEII